MKLSRDQVKEARNCIKCFDCNDCSMFPQCFEKTDLLETLEATYAEMDAKELQHEKARREVELQLEKANKVIRRMAEALNDGSYKCYWEDCDSRCNECIIKCFEQEVSDNESEALR